VLKHGACLGEVTVSRYAQAWRRELGTRTTTELGARQRLFRALREGIDTATPAYQVSVVLGRA